MSNHRDGITYHVHVKREPIAMRFLHFIATELPTMFTMFNAYKLFIIPALIALALCATYEAISMINQNRGSK